MGKLTDKQKLDFQERVKYYKNLIDEAEKKQKELNQLIIKEPENEWLNRIKSANNNLNIISLNCAMSEMSYFILGIKNTAYLDRARQTVYEVLSNIEKIVTNYVDVPFTDYEEQLHRIDDYSDAERVKLIKMMGFCVDRLADDFGENSKWRWSFVEIYARVSVIAKNLLDMRRYQKCDDPREEGYRERREHLKLVLESLTDAAKGYRDKFELSTKDPEDMKKGIDHLKALLRIYQINQDAEKVESTKKNIEVWSAILDKHMAALDKAKRSGPIKK
ncbi:MAG: hypothetical protein IKQ61_01115 [Spirochaetales bacterium]|nr:hypothetical protein [Spirochaetales bacterium]